MKSKTVLYAAVGAPVVAARKVGDKVAAIRATLSKEADSIGKSANKQVDVWAEEGEKVVSRISDGKMVDELASKVDFDQVSEQVSKLRDQLEDILATWRASFRPEKAGTKTPVTSEPAKAQATEIKSASQTTTTRKAPAKRTVAAKKAPAGKTQAAKKDPVKKAQANKAPAAKKAS